MSIYLNIVSPDAAFGALFSDWGSASWSEDKKAAVKQAHTWLETVAKARGWSEYWLGTAKQFLKESVQSEDKPKMIFGKMAQKMEVQAKALPGAIPAGWEKLAGVYRSASGTAKTVEANREQGTITAAVKSTTEALATATDPTKSWWPWAVGGGIVLTLGIALQGSIPRKGKR